MSTAVEPPPWTCQVVSAEMPCGAAMLANVFAAWNVPIIDPWGLSTAALYTRGRDGAVHLPPGPTGFEALMPVFAERKRFPWNQRVVPWFHHRVADQAPAPKRVVWVIRDPRDCLYSDWRRQGPDRPPLLNYLRGDWRGTGRTPVDYLLDFSRSWLNAESGQKVLRVRFEAIKTDPAETLRHVSAHIDLAPDIGQLDAVPHLVDFDRARAVSQALPDRLHPPFEAHRAGACQEWRARWTKEELEALPRGMMKLIEQLGY